MSEMSAPELLPTASHPVLAEGIGCFQCLAVGTNAAGTAWGVPLCARLLAFL